MMAISMQIGCKEHLTCRSKRECYEGGLACWLCRIPSFSSHYGALPDICACHIYAALVHLSTHLPNDPLLASYPDSKMVCIVTETIRHL
jgi:hypothetical protein